MEKASRTHRWQPAKMLIQNTDNTSVYGLSIDYGPFAFMDDFDPAYTPNHDDHMLRYSYKNQPTIIWWNLVRLGEAVGEMMGMGAGVDDPKFVDEGVAEDQESAVVTRAEKLITQAGEEFKAVFLDKYKELMTARLGLRNFKDSDFDQLFSEGLDTLEELELDFSHFFRRLSGLKVADLASPEARREKAGVFFHKEGPPKSIGEREAREKLAQWLDKWRQRVLEDWASGTGQLSDSREEERIYAMKRVNPNFVPRGWVLDEVIRRVEKEGERDVLNRVMHMALNPFEDAWHGRQFNGVEWNGDAAEEQRWIGDIPRAERAMQCSCSS